ncbi:hypothetical protein, partial [Herbaspirillum seropedicae]|uniref:hypothetical protein n=1 Tax=Herbaspirillum seropedicae TaxID=964 RepID=UPI0031DD42DD
TIYRLVQIGVQSYDIIELNIPVKHPELAFKEVSQALGGGVGTKAREAGIRRGASVDNLGHALVSPNQGG